MSSAVAPAGQPAVPHALRRPAVAVAGTALLIFGVLAGRYGGESAAGRLDGRVQSVLDTAAPAGPALRDVVELGDRTAVVALSLVLCGIALRLGQRRIAVLALVGPGLTGIVTTVAKPVIGRTIDGDLAYPSGHTGGATALSLVAALLLVAVLRAGQGAGATIIAVGAVFGGGTMALALVVGKDHYPTDTVGGFCVAVAVVLGCALAVDGAAGSVGADADTPPAPPR